MALKFSTAYGALMLGCGAVALSVPARVTEGLRGPLSKLFIPVSWPTKGVVDAVVRTVTPAEKPGGVDPSVPKTPTEAMAENAALRGQVTSLLMQIDELKKQIAEKSNLGRAGERSVVARVMGVDSSLGSSRQFLNVNTAWAAGVTERMAVIYPQGLVGRVTSSALGGVRVQLVTDRESRVQAAFARFVRNPDGSLIHQFPKTASAPLVIGDGGAQMKVKNLSAEDVKTAGIAVGDWLVVNDAEFPDVVRGFRIGQVTAIRSTAPLWAELTVSPATDLRMLREVMIVNRP